jgi:hypothetical protein
MEMSKPKTRRSKRMVIMRRISVMGDLPKITSTLMYEDLNVVSISSSYLPLQNLNN